MKTKQFFYSCLVLATLLILLLSIKVVISNPVEHTSPVTTIDWHPNGVLLASGSEDGSVKIWDTSLGSVVLALDLISDVHSVDWSPDGLYLATGLADGTMTILDVEQEQTILIYQSTTDSQDDRVSSVAWHPEGNKLAIAFYDTIEIINPYTDVLHEKIPTNLYDYSYLNSIAWSSDGELLAYKNASSRVLIWNSSSASVIQVLYQSSGIEELAWSPDNSKLAIATRRNRYSDVIYGDESSVVIRDTMNATIQSLLDSSVDVHTVAWSPSGNKVAFGGGNEYQGMTGDNSVKVWNVSTINNTFDAHLNLTLIGHSGEVNSVRWSPDGSRLASGSVDHTIRIWNASTGASISVLGVEVPQETKPYPRGEPGWIFGFFFVGLSLLLSLIPFFVLGSVFFILIVRSRRKKLSPRVPYTQPIPVIQDSTIPTMKRFCPHCGSQSPVGKFCTACGAKFE